MKFRHPFIVMCLNCSVILLTAANANGQMMIRPGSNCIEYNRITNEQSTMTWYLLQDTTPIEIGTVTNLIETDSVYLTLVTTVKMRQSARPWVDSTIAEKSTLRPLYHASYNTQRDMVLRYGNRITGSYADKLSGGSIVIADSATSSFFDSNLYPTLIRWLPLRTGYMKDLAIYDYNPRGKKGVMKVSVICVRQSDYIHQNRDRKRVYLVTVKDEMSQGTTTYYVDVETRKLWKMVIAVGEQKMMMEAV